MHYNRSNPTVSMETDIYIIIHGAACDMTFDYSLVRVWQFGVFYNVRMMFLQLFCQFLSRLLHTIYWKLGSITINVSYITYNNPVNELKTQKHQVVNSFKKYGAILYVTVATRKSTAFNQCCNHICNFDRIFGRNSQNKGVFR